jgi:hypothetical protein
MHIASAELPPSQRAWTSTEHVPSDKLGVAFAPATCCRLCSSRKAAHFSIGRSAFGVSYAIDTAATRCAHKWTYGAGRTATPRLSCERQIRSEIVRTTYKFSFVTLRNCEMYHPEPVEAHRSRQICELPYKAVRQASDHHHQPDDSAQLI